MAARTEFETSYRHYMARRFFLLDEDDCYFIMAGAAKLREWRGEGVYLFVPMHYRETCLGQYLDRMAPQARETDSAIVIFFNGDLGSCSPEDFGATLSAAEEQVARAKREYDCESLFLVHRHFHHQATMGRIRGLACDLILKHVYDRGEHDPIILCNDIDLILPGPDYLKSYNELFAARPETKFACGPVYHGYKGTPAFRLPFRIQIPELYIYNEFVDAINYCARAGLINYERRVMPEGSNMCFSGNIYCAVGGYDFSKTAGEDDDLGRALHRYNPNAFDRGFSVEAIYQADPILGSAFNDVGWLITDPRRVLKAIAAEKPGVEAWADEPFMANPGAGMSTFDLAERCARNANLISLEAVRAASNPDNHSYRATIAAQLMWLLNRSLEFDRKPQTREQQAHVLERMGLQFSEDVTRSADLSAVRLDWFGSNLIQNILRLH